MPLPAGQGRIFEGFSEAVLLRENGHGRSQENNQAYQQNKGQQIAFFHVDISPH
jgi:hypothetical protein